MPQPKKYGTEEERLAAQRETCKRWRATHPEHLAEYEKRRACNKLVDAALKAKDDPDSLFHNAGLVEDLVGVSCSRLQKVAEAHASTPKRGRQCPKCKKFSPWSASRCVSCHAFLDPERENNMRQRYR